MIEYLNRKLRMVVDEKNNQGTITHFFGCDGEDCEPEDAITCVAECDGKHYAIVLSDYESASSN